MGQFDTEKETQPSLFTTRVIDEHRDASPHKRRDDEGHRLADEFQGNGDTVFFTRNERRAHTAKFSKGRIKTDAAGGRVDTRDGFAMNAGGKGRYIYTMMPNGEFVIANAVSEMARLNPNGESGAAFKRVHHTTLSHGRRVAAAGEMKIKNGKLRKITDKSGHYQPKPQLTRQALVALAAQGVDLGKVKLELEQKGNVPKVKAMAGDLLGIDADDPRMQETLIDRTGGANDAPSGGYTDNPPGVIEAAAQQAAGETETDTETETETETEAETETETETETEAAPHRGRLARLRAKLFCGMF